MTRARATATRCCSPADSSSGLWCSLPARSTRAMTSRIRSASSPFFVSWPGDRERQRDVLGDVEERDQVERLEDEAGPIATEAGRVVIRELADRLALEGRPRPTSAGRGRRAGGGACSCRSRTGPSARRTRPAPTASDTPRSASTVIAPSRYRLREVARLEDRRHLRQCSRGRGDSYRMAKRQSAAEEEPRHVARRSSRPAPAASPDRRPGGSPGTAAANAGLLGSGASFRRPPVLSPVRLAAAEAESDRIGRLWRHRPDGRRNRRRLRGRPGSRPWLGNHLPCGLRHLAWASVPCHPTTAALVGEQDGPHLLAAGPL